MNRPILRSAALAAFVFTVALALAASGSAAAATATYAVGPSTDRSTSCATQNAEVEQAVDPELGYVYEDWMGCNGIGFARSTDGGKTFSAPITLPGSPASTYNSWDPSIARRTQRDGLRRIHGRSLGASGTQWSLPPMTTAEPLRR